MMRLIGAIVMATLTSAILMVQTTLAQQAGQAGAVPDYARNPPAQTAGAQTAAGAQIARQQDLTQQQALAAQRQSHAAGGQGVPAAGNPAENLAIQPFPPLAAAAQAQLQQLLHSWEQQSQGTKTLECKFQRWHFDMFAAPAGIHATRADGILKYAAPDKGLFRVDRLMFYQGMGPDDKPQYAAQDGQFGEYWVCNGKELIEFDRGQEVCKIQELPPEMQGQQIFNSPLPFVFNLDANKIQARYWVRQVAAPKPGILVVEAWPKRQEDRAQYKMVVIALDAKTFLPQALIMYAPNFNAKTAPKWDHYEFVDMKRNSIGQGMQVFLRNFIDPTPPANWQVLRNRYQPPAEAPIRQAALPQATEATREDRMR